MGLRDALNAQMPRWAVTDLFDVHAKSADPNPSKDQLRLMMQSLLAERFKLAVHMETRQLPVYMVSLLKPGKTGAGLRPHADDFCSTAPDMPPSRFTTSASAEAV